ncbi:MAG TPA: glycosyltransferase [Myxococcota bacterium]|nr:glycosyltransferase [Myxococcota bacterium]
MKHVLVVSYHFPPAGGVPVRRVLRILRHLPTHGWRCTVLTADRPFDPFHGEDAAGLATLPPVERVLRAPARSGLERILARGFDLWSGAARSVDREAKGPPADGPAGGTLRRLLHETLIFPDAKRPWVRGAVALARAAAREDPFDLVLATAFPWSAFVVADRLRRSLGRPMVLDFRDAWTLNPRGLWTGPRNRRLEAELVSRAAAVVVATDWIRDHLRALYPELPPERFVTVTNGYDPAEQPPPDPSLRDPHHLVLTYTGTFNDALPPSRFDHTPYYLIEAIRRVSVETRAALRVRLVGRVGSAYRAHVRALGLEDVIEVVPPVAHARALQYQMGADVLVLVVCDAPGAAAVLTAKLVEYVAARKPILALAPDCEASRVVNAHELGWVEPPADVERIAQRLEALVGDWRRGALSKGVPDVPALAASVQVERFAEVLTRALVPERASGHARARALGPRASKE